MESLLTTTSNVTYSSNNTDKGAVVPANAFSLPIEGSYSSQGDCMLMPWWLQVLQHIP